MSVLPPLLIQVEVWSSAGRVAYYVMDHNDGPQRRVLGEQCRNAFEAGQSVHTAPVGSRSAVAELIERDKAQREALETCERWFAKHSPTAPLICGGHSEHPMLTMLRAVLADVGAAT